MRVPFLLMAVMAMCSLTHAQSNRHVIQLSVDGLHSEGLRWLMQSQPTSFTNFQRFVNEGSTTFDARSDYSNAFTLPNHTSMLTGRPVNQVGDQLTLHHGYTNNSTPKASDTLHNAGNPNLSYVASTFDIAHDSGLTTALYTSKPKFVIYEQSYNATAETTGGRPDQFLGDGDQGTDKIDQYLFLRSNDTSSELIDRFVAEMPEEEFGYTFLHLTEPDASGHSLGWRSEAWDESVALVDQHLGRIFEMIQQDDALRDNTTIVLTSDHGGLGLFHDNAFNPNMYTVPFFVWGQDVAPGTDLYEMTRGTRVRPLGESLSYEASTQPIRNGDGANLSLSLLGLPTVDGSLINNKQDLLVDYVQRAVWHGANSDAGEAGDGRSWDDRLNWSRAANEDTLVRPGDDVVFASNSEEQSILLAGDRTVRSFEFLGDYAITGGNLHVISGAIDLADDVVVHVDGQITSQTSLVVSGAGALEISGTMPDLLRTGGPIAGEIDVIGSATFLNEVRPGVGIGSISVDRDLTLGGSTVLVMQISETADGTTIHDSISVANRLIIRGGMEVEPVEYSDPTDEAQFDQFRLLTVGRRVGDLRFLEYDASRLTFDFETATTQTHFAGDGLFRILQHDSDGVTLTNYRAFAGDANGDGAFNTQDFVTVFQVGVYEDGENDNANWLSGDWNGDQDFTTSDLVLALANGRFEQPPLFGNADVNLVPEPQLGILLPLFAMLAIRRRQRSS